MTTVFSSISQLDVIQVKEFGFWEHSSYPTQSNIGDVVVVIPNKIQRDIYGVETIAAVGIISMLANDIISDISWASNNAGSDKHYVTRVHIDNVKLVKLTDIESWVMDGRMGPKGIRYTK